MPYVSIRGGSINKFQLNRYARAVRAGAGMGQADDGTTGNDAPLGGTGFEQTNLPIITLGDNSPFSGIGVTATSPTTGAPTSSPSSSDQTLLNSLGSDISSWFTPSANVPGAVASASAPSSGGGFNLSSFLNSITGSAAGAAKLYQTLQGPSLVAGTNAIYNPATGQYYNPTTGQVVNPGGTSTLGLPNIDPTTLLLYGGLAVGAVFLLSMLGKH